jgi:hypothetical protein
MMFLGQGFNMEFTQLTENEVNNLIFTLMKYTFQKLDERLKNPSNRFIKQVMVEVMDDPTVPNIIDKTFKMTTEEYRILVRKHEKEYVMEFMQKLADFFMSEPYELRCDLGRDKDAEEFITKH